MPSIRVALWIATALLGAPCRGVFAQQPAATGMIVGHVLGQDGAPFRDAEVWATAPDAPDVVVRRARTDGDGMFVLSRLASQPMTVFARAPAMTTARAEASPTANEPVAVTLRLWEARTLRGRILDPDGKPIAGASLVASKDFAVFAYVPVEGTTDAEGRFELRGVPIGECCLRAIAAGFAFNGHVFDDVFDEQVDLTLPQNDGITLRIEVQGLPGPAALATRVRVQAVAMGGEYSMPRLIEQPRLAADGTCTVKGLPETQWRVTLEHPEFRFVPSILPRRGKAPEPVRAVATPIGPIAKAVPSEVERQVDETSIAVRGRVVDARGFPMSYVTVELQEPMPNSALLRSSWLTRARTTSGADGSFAFPRLQASEALRIRARGGNAFGTTEKFQVVAGQATEQDVATQPAGRVEGQLLDASGEVVPGVSVRLSGESNSWVMTDHRGRFVFVGLAPDSYRLAALIERITQFADQPAFEVKSGETVRRDLVLR